MNGHKVREEVNININIKCNKGITLSAAPVIHSALRLDNRHLDDYYYTWFSRVGVG